MGGTGPAMTDQGREWNYGSSMSSQSPYETMTAINPFSHGEGNRKVDPSRKGTGRETHVRIMW
jgi:hypothetical protein